MATTTTTSNTPVAVGFDIESINAGAVILAKADASYEGAIPAAASAVAKVLGTKPSFDLWTGVSEAWQNAYRQARGCVEKTAENRWLAVAKYMADNFELKKPEKQTAESKKKAAARSKHDKAVKAARAQCPTPADALKKAAELVAEGKVNEAKVYTEAGHAMAKESAKKATDAGMAKLKKARDAVLADARKCEDEKALLAAQHILKHGLDSLLKTLGKLAEESKSARKAPAPAKA